MKKGIIRHPELKALTENGGVKAVAILGNGDAFMIRVTTTATGEKWLHTQKGTAPRRFSHLDTLLKYLKEEIGLGKATIDFEGWNPKQPSLV